MRVAVVVGADGGGLLQALAEDGTPQGPPEPVPDLAGAVAEVEPGADSGPKEMEHPGEELVFLLEGALEHFQVVGVAHPRHVPAIADEPRRHVIAIRQGGLALDGDPVVVVDPAQVGQPQVPGE
jgi:hypothetical protein